ncbi:endolytic transglycosylase MltG [Gordonia jinhuaensis]|uniref:Endolytic murein transglycosylase n=1 Tax=Gordonia jinhuaensis TaxID=1517702 RepID=A0A916WRA4_9ACTN|nr:hypothetical protein GCM10011489_11850 [Gordonia jinhuaensis]
MVIALVAVFVLIVAGAGTWAGLRVTGFFVDDADYSDTAGRADVLVEVPQNATLTQTGTILTDQGVVASTVAFTRAAGDNTVDAGFYQLRTHVSAKTAVSMLSGDDHRVGRLNVPPGRQLDSKPGIDGKTTPGIFAMIADASSYTLNGQRHGVTVEQLAQAAATDTPAQLGVPGWATARVQALTGDHRRIEGLIAAMTFEALDPSLDATGVLRQMITASAAQFDTWGLTTPNTTGLDPYDTLTAASVVEREVPAGDYAKVARVIVNRLGANQKLEMDSTANYAAKVQNIDVSGDSYTSDNKWNTYQHVGLPVTPIGSVGQAALAATRDPAQGRWLYFVTIDSGGTTLFADNYEEQIANRRHACASGLLKTGCDG